MKKSFLCIFLIACMLLSFVGCSCKHEYSEEWSNDDSTHWRVCTGEDCDEIADKAAHEWDEGTVTLLPTATTEGVLKRTCTVCGRTMTQTLSVSLTLEQTKWAEAFLLPADNYTMTIASIDHGMWSVQKNGQRVKVFNALAPDGKESYFAVEGEKYYRYDKVGAQVTKQEITKQDYQSATTMVDWQDLVKASFTYNEELNFYYATQLVLNDVTYEGISIAFEDSRVVRVGFTEKVQGSADEGYAITVTYGTVAEEIVLPQVTQ